MKKLTVLSLVALALMMGACQNNQNTEGKKKTLVAYFSASEAHVTAQVAKTLADMA